MRNLMVGTWFDIKEGCSMRSSVGGSNLAHLMLGETELELAFDMDSLRAFVTMCTAALAEMDSRYEQECAEYEDQDGRARAEHLAMAAVGEQST